MGLSSTLVPLGRNRRCPTLPAQFKGGLGVFFHKLDILHVQGRGEPNGIRKEDEEDADDDSHDKGKREEAEKRLIL